MCLASLYLDHSLSTVVRFAMSSISSALRALATWQGNEFMWHYILVLFSDTWNLYCTVLWSQVHRKKSPVQYVSSPVLGSRRPSEALVAQRRGQKEEPVLVPATSVRRPVFVHELDQLTQVSHLITKEFAEKAKFREKSLLERNVLSHEWDYGYWKNELKFWFIRIFFSSFEFSVQTFNSENH